MLGSHNSREGSRDRVSSDVMCFNSDATIEALLEGAFPMWLIKGLYERLKLVYE
jgi:hypothetical protein